MSLFWLILALDGSPEAAAALAQAQGCAALTAAALETSAAPSKDLERAYVVWTSRYASFAARSGATPTEINAVLEADRTAAQTRLAGGADKDRLAACLAETAAHDPLGLK